MCNAIVDVVMLDVFDHAQQFGSIGFAYGFASVYELLDDHGSRSRALRIVASH